MMKRKRSSYTNDGTSGLALHGGLWKYDSVLLTSELVFVTYQSF